MKKSVIKMVSIWVFIMTLLCGLVFYSVIIPQSTIEVSAKNITKKYTVTIGATKKLKEKKVKKWKSSDKKIVSVDKKGVLTANKAGKVTITAITENGKRKYTIVVPKMSISKKEVTISVGDSTKLNVKNAKNIKWASSNKKVVKVKDGKITAIGSGKATISAKAGNTTVKCTVTVIEPDQNNNSEKQEEPKQEEPKQEEPKQEEPNDQTDNTTDKQEESEQNNEPENNEGADKGESTSTSWTPEDTSDVQVLPNGDYITNETITIETAYAILTIDPNVYVRSDVAERVDVIFATIEKCSGLKYSEGTNYKGKIKLFVVKGTGEDAKCEYNGGAYASGDEVVISSGDLFVTDSYAIVHESAHALQFMYSSNTVSDMLCEGFAEYTTYKVLNYLHNYDPAHSLYISNATQVIFNDYYSDKIISAQPMEHWLVYNYPEGTNLKYGIGLRFFMFMDERYGNYSKWLLNINQELGNVYDPSNRPTAEQIISLFNKSYSMDVFSGFYEWITQKDPIFYAPCNGYTVDYTHVHYIDIFPGYYYNMRKFGVGNGYKINEYGYGLKYDNLVIGFDKARMYLEKYKNEDTSKWVLQVDKDVKLTLYDSAGKYLGSSYGNESVSLAGVSYVKLNGQGITWFEVENYCNDSGVADVSRKEGNSYP